jgi:hypothetical protein
LSDEDELRKAVERRKAALVADGEAASDSLETGIAEWSGRIAPAIVAAVRDANQISMSAGIRFAIRRLAAQGRITPEGTTEFPAIIVEKSSGRSSLASQLSDSVVSAVEDRTLSEPCLDIRLADGRFVEITAHGCPIITAASTHSTSLPTRRSVALSLNLQQL